ncbi:sugar phosphate isomerase/epimerase family protein [Kribbella speibonae]|uniref:Sugar phosphate isomerase/epimerase n=1 Tax=Kribbella speibonae TaxID=1572660 RepID=A0A4R0ITB0_9ACTN|nr:sugar phosphate isomerase/epimerase [Kribbella speibonae]TCC36337.1 sugar phosphate isomerase/epimerase [Kribbella speibonae]
MKLGAYTACLHDKSLEDALEILGDLGLTSVEVNAGGFIGTPHLPVEELLASASARAEYLATFEKFGIELTALNCNGNPLHPDPEVTHGDDLKRTIKLAGLLGIQTVIAMSGLPAAEPGGTRPSWTVIPWDSVYKETLDYQWDEVAVPFWTGIDTLAAQYDVRVAIEMHPHNLVFNPATLKRLVERTDATHIGAEMDPSHLFWQHIDPIQAIEDLGDLVYFAAAKDTLIHETAAINGVLDDRFEWIPAEEQPMGLGGRHTLTRWPAVPGWSFVAVGRGHDLDFWARFLLALQKVNPDLVVNIEHEDASFGQIEGLKYAADNLLDAAAQAGVLS